MKIKKRRKKRGAGFSPAPLCNSIVANHLFFRVAHL
jgi:hypothetical protein